MTLNQFYLSTESREIIYKKKKNRQTIQSAMLNARLCFIFSSQLHVSMHQNVDATNIGCHAYLTGFFHPTWAPGLRANARTAAGARLSRPEPAQRAAGSLASPGDRVVSPPELPQSAPCAHARSPRAVSVPPVFGKAATGQLRREGRGGERGLAAT